MIDAFYVQVCKNKNWMRVTTIRVDHKVNEEQKSVERAYRSAMSQLAGWRGYYREPLRIVAEDMSGRVFDASSWRNA